MDFNQVRYFLALADTLNFTKAARECAVSQPALTQAIRRLEDELGGKLLQRDGAQSALTVLGEALRDQFRQIDHTRKLVKATADSIVSGTQAPLHIGVMCTIGAHRIAPVLQSFKENHPHTSIVLHDVIPETIPELLFSGVLDGAFCTRTEPSRERLRYLELYEENMVVACSAEHAFRNQPKVSLNAVAAEPYVDRLHCEFRPTLLRYINDNDLALNITASSQREDWIQGIVSQGLGVTVLPEHSVVDTNVSTRPISDAGMTRQVEFVLRNTASHAAGLEAFVTALENCAWPS